MTIAQDIQEFATDNLVTLFEVDFTLLGGVVQFLSPNTKDGQPITFDGQQYVPIPIFVEGYEISGRGALARPTLRISNVLGSVSSLLQQFGDDLGGTTVTRRRTFQKYLDGEPSADPTAIFPLDVFVIDRKVAHTKAFVEFELISPLDKRGLALPRRQVLRDACTHVYRNFNLVTGAFDYTSVTCPYVGVGSDPDTDGPHFDALGNPTDAPNDQCGKRVSDCKLRFSPAALPGRFFPGTNRVRR